VIDDRALLLGLARAAIETSLSGGAVTLPAARWLQAPAAVFVTLRQHSDGALRGCVGSIEPRLPLGEAVVAAARGAAFRDGRFAPLSYPELERIRVEVSVLSSLASLRVLDEAEACVRLDRTRPGAVLSYGRRKGVLLPKVWQSIGDAAEFLGHLKRKAGLSPAFWSDAIELHVFTSEDFGE
jgi:AmmeMemoRadiSam system protein A